MKDIERMDQSSIFDHIEDIIILGFIITVLLLKLTGVIKISWFWLLSPIWGTFVLAVVILVIMSIVAIIINIYDKIKEKKNERN